METRKPCANCDGPNNGTADLCSSCYEGLGRLTWVAILAGQRRPGYPEPAVKVARGLCTCFACEGGRFRDCVYRA